MQITRVYFLLLILAYLLAACGAANSPSGPRDLSRKSEIELRFTPGLEQTVQVDSINWNLGLYNFTVPDQVEIDGRFYIAFRNLSDRDLELRYELRFFDEDTFLVDLFRPFGQPLHLAAGQGLETSDEFFLRIPDPLDLRFIATMRLVANITAPP